MTRKVDFTESTSGLSDAKRTLLEKYARAEVPQTGAAFQWNPGGSCRASGVLRIQPKGSKPPLFLIRGGPLFLPLARRLGSDQPMLGLHLLSTDATHLRAQVRFEDIASALVVKMREVQPNGPYYLGGLCINGVMAYEMANQLAEQGQYVGLLVLLDSPNPTRYRDFRGVLICVSSEESRYERVRRRIALHAQKLVHLQRKDMRSYVRERLEGIRRKWNRMTSARGYGHELHNSDYDPWDWDRLIHAAFNQYRPQPYRGRVAFFQSSDWLAGSCWDLQLAWRGLVNGVFDVFKIRGAYDSLLYESNVDGLADKLSVCLREAHQSDIGVRLGA
jgi:thioesterase domain-containing protein